MEDEYFGNVSLYYIENNPYMLKCTKKYSNSNEQTLSSVEDNINKINFLLRQSTLKFLERRIKGLPLAIHQCTLDSYNKSLNHLNQEEFEAEISFDIGSWSIEDLIVEHGAILPQEYGFKLLYFLSQIGSRLQDRLENYKSLKSEYVYIHRKGLRVVNMYLWEEYIQKTSVVS